MIYVVEGVEGVEGIFTTSTKKSFLKLFFLWKKNNNFSFSYRVKIASSTLHPPHPPQPSTNHRESPMSLPCHSRMEVSWTEVMGEVHCECFKSDNRNICTFGGQFGAIGWRLLYHCDLNIISCISRLLISNRSESTKLTYESVNVSSYVLLYFEIYFEMWWTDIVCIHGSDMGGNMGFQILCHNNTWDICMVMDECINATLHAPSTATLHHCTIHFFITLLPQMLRK